MFTNLLSCILYTSLLINVLNVISALDMETFTYDEEDFIFKASCGNTCSNFDAKIRFLWNEKLNQNLFRYKLNITKEKVLDDKFYLQLNTDRGYNRRKPSDITSINQPFDPSAFNFHKINPEEKLFNFVHKSRQNDTGKHAVLINVSPMEFGHILLVPNLEDNLPQILTEDALKLSVELILLSSSSYFRFAFNSLGGYASVNHLHLHGYYLQRCMFLETSPVEQLAYSCYQILNFPSKGFAFQIKSVEEIDFIVKDVYHLVKFLQTNNIPHNLFMTRGIPFDCSSATDDKIRTCLRIFVWPRKSSYSNKDPTKLCIATCELFGHLVVKDGSEFESLDEEKVIDLLRGTTNDEFNLVVKHIPELFRK